MSDKEMKFEIDQTIRIMKPAAVVFEAITSPKHLNRYFTSRAEGMLEKGAKPTWQWSDHPKTVPIEIVECQSPTRLVFRWPTHDEQYSTTVQFDLDDQKEKGTVVRVREGTWKTIPAGLANSYDNAGGWMHMLCCLKAYLEHNVDLRSKPIPENW